MYLLPKSTNFLLEWKMGIFSKRREEDFRAVAELGLTYYTLDMSRG